MANGWQLVGQWLANKCFYNHNLEVKQLRCYSGKCIVHSLFYSCISAFCRHCLVQAQPFAGIAALCRHIHEMPYASNDSNDFGGLLYSTLRNIPLLCIEKGSYAWCTLPTSTATVKKKRVIDCMGLTSTLTDLAITHTLTYIHALQNISCVSPVTLLFAKQTLLFAHTVTAS